MSFLILLFFLFFGQFGHVLVVMILELSPLQIFDHEVP
jgi:hypothetical protein